MGLPSRSAGLGFDLHSNPSPSPKKPVGAGASPFGKPKSELSKPSSTHCQPKRVIAMILESGALYCGVLVLNALALSFEWNNLYALLFVGVSDGLVDQMVNILPTLIFVRVGMGYCQWRQESAPAEVQVPAVRVPKRHERGLLEDVASEVIEIKAAPERFLSSDPADTLRKGLRQRVTYENFSKPKNEHSVDKTESAGRTMSRTGVPHNHCVEGRPRIRNAEALLPKLPRLADLADVG
ncbi:hypothetical protein C8R45DRAFT_938661 [Mycena sanguinolenta]|nr:hypothetical protein C8R45DRAFT_938661 [Mycena sanguinolenta]